MYVLESRKYVQTGRKFDLQLLVSVDINLLSDIAYWNMLGHIFWPYRDTSVSWGQGQCQLISHEGHMLSGPFLIQIVFLCT